MRFTTSPAFCRAESASSSAFCFLKSQVHPIRYYQHHHDQNSSSLPTPASPQAVTSRTKTRTVATSPEFRSRGLLLSHTSRASQRLRLNNMGTVLEDVFGSDFGSDEEQEINDDLPSRKSPKSLQTTPKEKPRPISFSESDDDDEPPPSRSTQKRKLEDAVVYRSSDDEIPRTKREDTFSSDDEDERLRERERGRERRKKRKKHEQRRKKPKSEDEYEEADGDRYDARPDPKPKVEEDEGEPPKPEKPKTAFEKALEENKAMRRPRKKEFDPAKVDNECVSFLERMMKARDDDVLANKKGKPALNKLKMLREVELMCMKLTHREALLDNMLLAIIKSWLDPTPDGSLPNVQIRESLLNILLSMPVDNDWVERLEGSQGLGRLVHFMSLREPHEPVKRMAEKLMRKWARPVYQSNANYHDLLEEFDKPDEGRRAPKDGIASERRVARETITKMKTTQEKLEEFSHTGKKREQILATVPKPGVFLYSALAESEIPTDPKALRDRSGKARMKKHNKTISRLRKLNRSIGGRAAKPSINGRDG